MMLKLKSRWLNFYIGALGRGGYGVPAAVEIRVNWIGWLVVFTRISKAGASLLHPISIPSSELRCAGYHFSIEHIHGGCWGERRAVNNCISAVVYGHRGRRGRINCVFAVNLATWWRDWPINCGFAVISATWERNESISCVFAAISATWRREELNNCISAVISIT